MKNTYLIDTNIIVYAYNEDVDRHVQAKAILESALNKNINAFLADKNLFEFFAIVTDKKRVENPVSAEDAAQVINFLINSSIRIVYPTFNTISKTVELAKKYHIRRQKIFDLILVSMMLENNIDIMLTANDSDFEKFEEIRVINPLKINHN